MTNAINNLFYFGVGLMFGVTMMVFRMQNLHNTIRRSHKVAIEAQEIAEKAIKQSEYYKTMSEDILKLAEATHRKLKEATNDNQ